MNWLYLYFQALKRRIGKRLYRKLKRIRLVFLHTALFAIFWIPYGVSIVLQSFTGNSSRATTTVVNYNVRSPDKAVQTWLGRLLATLHPIFYLYTHHHSRFIYFFRMCKRRLLCRTQSTPTEYVSAISTIDMETFEATG